MGACVRIIAVGVIEYRRARVGALNDPGGRITKKVSVRVFVPLGRRVDRVVAVVTIAAVDYIIFWFGALHKSGCTCAIAVAIGICIPSDARS